MFFVPLIMHSPKNVLHVLHFFVNNLLFTYLIKKTKQTNKKTPQVCQVSFCMWNLLFEWCLEPDEIIKRRLEAIGVLVIFTISAQQQLVLIETLQLFFRASVQGNFNSSKMQKYYHNMAI